MKKTFLIVFVMASKKKIKGISFLRELVTVDMNEIQDESELVKYFEAVIMTYQEINIISISDITLNK
jgi:hypothetical protein